MATRAEIRQRIISRYVARSLLTKTQFADALRDMDDKEISRLLRSLDKGDALQAGKILVKLRQETLELAGQAEADAILADDMISLAEIDKVL
jgi:hypothetical protein